MAYINLKPYGIRGKVSPIVGKGGKPFLQQALKKEGLKRQETSGEWYQPQKFQWYNPLSYKAGLKNILYGLGEFASPVRAAERVAAFGKSIWQKGFVPISKKIAGGIAPYVVPEKELPGVLKELGVYKQREFGEEFKETFGELARTISPAFMAGEIGTISGAFKGLGRGTDLLKTIAQGPKGTIARTMGRIPGVGKTLGTGYHKLYGAVSTPYRTGLTKEVLGPMAGAVTKAGAKIKLAEPFLSKEEQKNLREFRLIENRGLRLGLEFGVGAMTAVPLIGDILKSAGKFTSKVLKVAGRDDIIKTVDDYFTASPKIKKFYNSSEFKSKEEFYGAVSQYAAKQGIPLEQVDITIVEDFFRALTTSSSKLKNIVGIGADDIARLNKYGITKVSDFYNKFEKVADLELKAPLTYKRVLASLEAGGKGVERGVVGGAWQNIKNDKILQLKHFDAAYRQEILGPAGAKAIEKAYKLGKTKPFGEYLPKTEYMHRFKYFEQVPKAIEIGATKFEEMVGGWTHALRQTQAGKFFLTHPNTYRLSSEMIRGSDKNIINALGAAKGKRIISAIQGEIRKISDRGFLRSLFGPKSRFEMVSWNPFTPFNQLKLVIGKTGVYKSSGQITEAARKVWDSLIDAQIVVNQRHAIYSVGEWLGMKIPMLRSVQKFYNVSRFMARPTYHLQQLPETWIWGSTDIAKMKNPLAREVASRFIAQPVLVNPMKIELELLDILDPLAIERGMTNYDLLGAVKSRGIHFPNALVETIEKTPYWIRRAKQLKINSAFDLPEVKIILNKFKASDNPIVDLADLLRKNPDIPVGELGIAFKSMENKRAWTMVRQYAVNKAWRATKARAVPIQLYDISRSPAERALHHILFPTSYVKKVITKSGGYLIGASAVRPIMAREILDTYTALHKKVQERASETPKWKWLELAMNTFDPFSTEFPMGFGGLTPFVRTLAKMQAKPYWYNVSTPEGVDHTLSSMLPAYKEWFMKYPELFLALYGKEPRFGRGTFYFPELEDEKWKESETEIEKMLEEAKKMPISSFGKLIPKVRKPIPQPIGIYHKKKRGRRKSVPKTIVPVQPMK